MIFLKKYALQDGELLAMCDDELLGRILKEGKTFIDLEKYASFYKGELVTEEEAARRISPADIHSANVVGRRSADILIRCGVVTKDDVRFVGRVPIVQTFRME